MDYTACVGRIESHMEGDVRVIDRIELTHTSAALSGATVSIGQASPGIPSTSYPRMFWLLLVLVFVMGALLYALVSSCFR